MKPYPSITQSFGILGIFILVTAGAAVVQIVIQPIIGKDAAFLLTYVISTAGTFYIANLNRKNALSEPLNLRRPDITFLPVLLLVAVAIPFGITGPLTSLIPMSDFWKQLFLQFANEGLFTTIATIVAAPVMEELIFRGIILDGFLRRYDPVKSILISSFLFGLFHMNPWQFITAMIIGCFIGWIYYRTRSLTTAIFIHAVNNIAATVMMQIEPVTAENIDQDMVEYFGGWGPLMSVILLSLAIIVLGIIWLDKKLPSSPALIHLPAEPSPVQHDENSFTMLPTEEQSKNSE